LNCLVDIQIPTLPADSDAVDGAWAIYWLFPMDATDQTAFEGMPRRWRDVLETDSP